MSFLQVAPVDPTSGIRASDDEAGHKVPGASLRRQASASRWVSSCGIVAAGKDVFAMRKSVLLWAARTVIVAFAMAGRGSSAIEGSRDGATAQAAPEYVYRVLATSKTSTMEKELNDGAEAGFRFQGVMGGDTAGGSEVVVVMVRRADVKARVAYKLLATSKTSTMEKELQDAAGAGFEYRGQTVFKSAFGGEEVVCILERDASAGPIRSAYRLLATTKTSTLQKELQAAGAAGYLLMGMTVGKTAMGGSELVAIMRRAEQQ
jgi:hypothetical protein